MRCAHRSGDEQHAPARADRDGETPSRVGDLAGPRPSRDQHRVRVQVALGGAYAGDPPVRAEDAPGHLGLGADHRPAGPGRGEQRLGGDGRLDLGVGGSASTATAGLRSGSAQRLGGGECPSLDARRPLGVGEGEQRRGPGSVVATTIPPLRSYSIDGKDGPSSAVSSVATSGQRTACCAPRQV